MHENKRNLLFVDDDINFLELIEYDLSDTPWISEKFTINIERNADKALALVSSKEYAAVFIDLYMPGKDGILLCKSIRELQVRQPRIVILSGEMDTSELEEIVIKAGADRLLRKPFKKEILTELVDTI